MTVLHGEYLHDEMHHDELAPLETIEWESTPVIEEITYHVPVVQVNTPPAARNGAHFTLVLSTSQNPVQLLLGRDYDRVKAFITACDQPIVLAQSKEMASNPNNTNQASVGAIPSGQYVPSGQTVEIEHCDEVWVAATVSNLGRVAVQVARTERASA